MKGASPGWGGIHRLVSIVGRRSSIRLLCGSDPINPNNALEIGLVDQVVDIDQPNDDKIIEICHQFLDLYLRQKYKQSVFMIKETIAVVDQIEKDKSKTFEIDTFGKRWFSADNIDALKNK